MLLPQAQQRTKSHISVLATLRKHVSGWIYNIPDLCRWDISRRKGACYRFAWSDVWNLMSYVFFAHVCFIRSVKSLAQPPSLACVRHLVQIHTNVVSRHALPPLYTSIVFFKDFRIIFAKKKTREKNFFSCKKILIAQCWSTLLKHCSSFPMGVTVLAQSIT